MKTMLLGIYLAVTAIFCLLLSVHGVLPAGAAWLSFLLGLLSLICFMTGYTEKTSETSSENEKEHE